MQVREERRPQRRLRWWHRQEQGEEAVGCRGSGRPLSERQGLSHHSYMSQLPKVVSKYTQAQKDRHTDAGTDTHTEACRDAHTHNACVHTYIRHT